ncbi:MAG: group 1 truncated hemoglobin [Chthoniobacter sp.]|uniref:group 1 truncated hemoglobin n=1 Tax=Chthoniobacter sp. TaxID=2510640 RepID=UPI0032A656EE
MKKLFALIVLSLSLCAFAADPVAPASVEPLNTVCPVSGKAADPKVTFTYEGTTYAFADDTCRKKFEADRASSLYQQLGGKAALDAAVDLFYVKVLADPRVNSYFKDINMKRQKNKQKEFLSMALGAPIKYTGADLRTAHRELPGLNDSHFNAIAEHLQATLVELKVDKALIDRTLAIVETTRADVLNRTKPAN